MVKTHKPKFRYKGNQSVKKKKKMRENPPMWIEENEDENLKEICQGNLYKKKNFADPGQAQSPTAGTERVRRQKEEQ